MVEAKTERAVTPLDTTFEEDAQYLIKKHAALATAAGLIPVIGLDLVAVTGVQIQMVRKLAELHGLSISDNLLRVGLYSLTGSAASRAIALGVREALNTFSQFGRWGDNLTNAAVSGFITAATGEIYHAHFSAGGTVESLDVMQFVEYFSEQVKEGKLNINSFSGLQNSFRYLF